jgi:general stress protein 26
MSNHDQEIVTYVSRNPVAVLGTINKRGYPHGAAVYVYAKSGDCLYFITKTDTLKYQNILEHPHVSVTIVNSHENSTLQSSGIAKTITEPKLIGEIMRRMTEIYAKSVDWLPPIAKLRAGSYQIVCITLQHTRLANYLDARAGSEHIFIQAND